MLGVTGFTLGFGALIAKNYRIYALFQSQNSGGPLLSVRVYRDWKLLLVRGQS